MDNYHWLLVNSSLVLTWGKGVISGAPITVTLPYSYTSFYSLTAGGCDYPAGAWGESYELTNSTIRLATRGIEHYANCMMWYICIGS